jgi:hypothetical protein
MTAKTGTYTGDGAWQFVTTNFEPEVVFTFPESAEYIGFKMPDLWSARSNTLGASDSFRSGIKLGHRGFWVGPSARCNSSGVVYHYVALARSTNFKMAFAGAQGNATADRVMRLDDPAVNPDVVIAKRDSPKDGVLHVDGSTTALLGGTALTASGAISALAEGQFTVSNSVYVNEYDPDLELGEGIDFIAFEAGDNIATAAYTGTGATQTVSLPFQPAFVLVAKLSGTTIVGRVKTDTMDTDKAKAVGNGQGLVSYGLTFVPGGVELSAGSELNVNTATYVIAAFRDHTETPLAAPAVRKSGKKAILLPGRGVSSSIDCGTDASLVIDGPITLEWWGSTEPLGRTVPVPLMWRGSATTGAATTVSFGLYGNAWTGWFDNDALRWSGPSLNVVCADRHDLSTTATGILSSWRTGLLADYGKVSQFVASHQGGGVWDFYKNGRLTRQRAIDLTAESLPNIDGQAGHRMMLGAMRNSGSTVNATQRQRMLLARVYNRGLDDDEVAARFARFGMGSSDADITSGLVEEWDAANASGASLPATVNVGNNGTITNGSIITL